MNDDRTASDYSEKMPGDRVVFQWERISAILSLTVDFAAWLVIYQTFSLLRRSIGPEGSQLLTTVSLGQFAALALALFIVGGYDRRTDFLSLGYMSEHFITMAAAGCLGAIIIYVGAAYAESVRPSRAVLLTSVATFTPISLIYRRALAARLRKATSRKSFLVLGAGELAQNFYRSYLLSRTQQALRFVDPMPGAPRAGQGVDPENPLSPAVESHSLQELTGLFADCDGIIVVEKPRALPPETLRWLTRLHFAQTPVYTLASFYESQWRIVPVHTLDPMWPLEVSSQLANQSIYAHIKRVIDVTCSALAILLLSPLFVLLTLLTWAESGRPALFRQARIGRDSEPFTIFKFRTMRSRAGDQGPLYTQNRDPRVTRLGYWLRKLRLDELPQLWNVLRGDMSMIGPRAEWDRLSEQYESEIPFYHFRHLVKPGITGWAQVNYPYGASREDAVEKLKFDLYYIRHYSLRLDAMIVFKTLHIMLWGKGH